MKKEPLSNCPECSLKLEPVIEKKYKEDVLCCPGCRYLQIANSNDILSEISHQLIEYCHTLGVEYIKIQSSKMVLHNALRGDAILPLLIGKVFEKNEEEMNELFRIIQDKTALFKVRLVCQTDDVHRQLSILVELKRLIDALIFDTDYLDFEIAPNQFDATSFLRYQFTSYSNQDASNLQ